MIQISLSVGDEVRVIATLVTVLLSAISGGLIPLFVEYVLSGRGAWLLMA